MSAELDAMVAARRRAETVARMRRLARTVRRPSAASAPATDGDRERGQSGNGATSATRRCPTTTATCCTSSSGGSCAPARRAGRFTRATPSTGRPGSATLWLDGFDCSEEVWATFQIPIGLAFFMRSTVTDSVVAFYPSPAGATESELTLEAWEALVAANPVLEQLEADAEALVVNRMSQPAAVRDRADRPVLRAGRADQVTLGGDLRRQRDRGGRAAVLCRDPRARRLGAAETPSHEPLERRVARPTAARPRARVRDHRRRAHRVRRRADDAVLRHPPPTARGHEIQSIALTVAGDDRPRPARL